MRIYRTRCTMHSHKHSRLVCGSHAAIGHFLTLRIHIPSVYSAQKLLLLFCILWSNVVIKILIFFPRSLCVLFICLNCFILFISILRKRKEKSARMKTKYKVSIENTFLGPINPVPESFLVNVFLNFRHFIEQKQNHVILSMDF